jgi:hypothetical protein
MCPCNLLNCSNSSTQMYPIYLAYQDIVRYASLISAKSVVSPSAVLYICISCTKQIRNWFIRDSPVDGVVIAVQVVFILPQISFRTIVTYVKLTCVIIVWGSLIPKVWNLPCIHKLHTYIVLSQKVAITACFILEESSGGWQISKSGLLKCLRLETWASSNIYIPSIVIIVY